MSLPNAIYNFGASVPPSQRKYYVIASVVGVFAASFVYTSSVVDDRA